MQYLTSGIICLLLSGKCAAPCARCGDSASSVAETVFIGSVYALEYYAVTACYTTGQTRELECLRGAYYSNKIAF